MKRMLFSGMAVMALATVIMGCKHGGGCGSGCSSCGTPSYQGGYNNYQPAPTHGAPVHHAPVHMDANGAR